MFNTIKIANKNVGDHYPTFIIAELSANHNHDIDLAKKTIKAAKESGADAIKLQTYTADTITIDCDNDYFRINQGTIWDGKTLYNLYKEAYTPWEWQKDLKDYAESLGLILFSSPFDCTSVDFLEKLNVPAYKVASFEITDIPLIKYIASKHKPIIISTGIANLADIEEAVNTCKNAGNDNIVLLKCTSAYPAPFKDANLKTIPNLAETFNVVTGLSDHTLGSSLAIASIALGAKVIEKHFILDKNINSPDASFSMIPKEFKNMVSSIREVEKALGSINYSLSDKVKKNKIFARSLFVVKDMKKGEKITKQNVKSIRPGYGLHPKYYEDILGKKIKFDTKKGIPLSWNIIE
ncbi:MAG: pseudaminic acid synthase [Spirochaetes bacterium]|nr:pseudaminic acid synthase [Spirochaetota bacterium]